jgi:hypothetical protein
VQELERDRLLRIWVRLGALRRNLANVGLITEAHAQEYHSIVRLLEATGMVLDEFRIPDEALRNRVTSWHMLTGRTTHSATRYVEKALFFSKLDAILSDFEILTTKPPVSVGIGFSPTTRTKVD